MRMKGRPVGCTSFPLQSSLHVNDTLTEYILTGALQQMNHHFSLHTLVFCKLYTILFFGLWIFFKLHFRNVGSQVQVFM